MVKPTRNIFKPNTNLWNTKRRVWFQKNDDYADAEEDAKYQAQHGLDETEINLTDYDKKLTQEQIKEIKIKSLKWGPKYD